MVEYLLVAALLVGVVNVVLSGLCVWMTFRQTDDDAGQAKAR